MILVSLIGRNRTSATYLVQYRDTLKRVSVIKLPRKKKVWEIRYAIVKATRIPARNIRFLGNSYKHGQWYTEWMDYYG